MKLLFDENLAPSLVTSLADLFPRSTHVRDVGLTSSLDPVVWEYVARLGFTIVTKDGDFRQRSFLYGAPPKVVWIQSGNCSTRQIADLLRQHHLEIEAFGLAEEPAFLSLA